eukprot:scaffold1058_cov339-Pavlova_lutheri.AAC.1
MGSVPFSRSVSVQIPDVPYRKPVLNRGDLPSIRTPKGTDSSSGTVQRLFERGHHCPSSIWGPGGLVP